MIKLLVLSIIQGTTSRFNYVKQCCLDKSVIILSPCNDKLQEKYQYFVDDRLMTKYVSISLYMSLLRLTHPEKRPLGSEQIPPSIINNHISQWRMRVLIYHFDHILYHCPPLFQKYTNAKSIFILNPPPKPCHKKQSPTITHPLSSRIYFPRQI